MKRIDEIIDQTTVIAKNEFALGIYAGLRDQSGNLFLSPYSISSALAMAYAGARGETKRQMASVLHLPADDALTHRSFAELNNALTGGRGDRDYQLSVANALWGAKGVRFRTDFLETVDRAYGGRVAELDFKGAAEASRLTINQWVESQTQRKIKDLLPARAIDSYTLLVLTNAIYFKADWLARFDSKWTKASEFELADPEIDPGRQNVRVPFMQGSGRFEYFQEPDLQVLEMQYRGGDLGMVVILPHRSHRLAALEESLTVEKLSTMFAGLSPQSVDVQIPKFKLTQGFDLGELLSEMGMPLAFSGGADFSGMLDGQDPLFLSMVMHRAYLDVDEKGTEAAAATAVLLGRGPQTRPVVFRADHPFLFVIRHRRTGVILFIGRLVNPCEHNVVGEDYE